MTEEVPYCQHKQDAQVMFAIVKKKYPRKPERMTGPMRDLWKICKMCWVHDPKKRSKILEIASWFSCISSLVHQRAVVRTTSTRKRKRSDSSPSYLMKRSKTTRLEKAPSARINANVSPIVGNQNGSLWCREV